ncbi:Ground-like domain-containing protein [Caenorhabditis elegans]|uniref:Ground-like domain-containing protein n=1 Tax=Caenorhabditis elegans TaxID=6239 RepID=A0A163VU65_CAEEL|nr:Ground-like domain-containing protein [Caenorhabditis elegans]SAP35568.1 Ground-like domain-containing protein [Caenorhabditis elegans]|eukprot:NP_001317808.1 GRound-Like (grd related) [Caenorhabditis elegans]
MVCVLVLILMASLTANSLFFNGGGGCGCRPQQCGCAAASLPVRSYCPPSPCGRQFQSFPSYTQPYSPVSFRPPPPTIIQQQPYYSVPHPIPIQTQQFHNSYQQTPVFTSSYNAPPFASSSSYSNAPNSFQNAPIQVASAKETSADTFDTLIQKSKPETTDMKNDLDVDNALSNFETSLQAYKSMNRNGIRRAQAAKTEKAGKCSSERLQQIMEEAMSSNVSVSKLKISRGAKKEFGYNFDVICSQFDFSYLISSNIFCRVELDGQICLAYEN